MGIFREATTQTEKDSREVLWSHVLSERLGLIVRDSISLSPLDEVKWHTWWHAAGCIVCLGSWVLLWITWNRSQASFQKTHFFNPKRHHWKVTEVDHFPNLSGINTIPCAHAVKLSKVKIQLAKWPYFSKVVGASNNSSEWYIIRGKGHLNVLNGCSSHCWAVENNSHVKGERWYHSKSLWTIIFNSGLYKKGGTYSRCWCHALIYYRWHQKWAENGFFLVKT